MSRRRSGPTGVLLVDKPRGPSSHEVVDFVRWGLRTRAVGHCGTLDPMATGLLVVCLGRATRLAAHLTAVDKTYRARFVLGRATDTGDAEGQSIEEAFVSPAVVQQARGTVATMVGSHDLAPPAYSAVKIGGQRAHELARRGQRPTLAPRAMTVHAVESVATLEDELAIECTVTVSKGTYVRSLAQWLGAQLGVPAHLGCLRRMASGRFGVDHPAAAGGLEATALPPGRDGAPRWRIRPHGGPTQRDAVGAWLLDRLLTPRQAVPFPVVMLHGSALRRLTTGQAVAVGPGELGGAVEPQDAPMVAVEGGGGLILARVQRGAGGVALQPARTIVSPAVEVRERPA